MNIVIDSSAWLEYLSGGARAKKTEKYFKQHKIMTPVIVIYEIYKKIKKERGEGEAIFVTANLERLSHDIIDISREVAIHAADISIEHKIPMADAIIYASALCRDATVITLDSHFEGLPKAQVVG